MKSKLQKIILCLFLLCCIYNLWTLRPVQMLSLIHILRKKIAVEAQTGMLIETMWLLPVAAIYLFAIASATQIKAKVTILSAPGFSVHWPDADVPAGCDVLW